MVINTLRYDARYVQRQVMELFVHLVVLKVITVSFKTLGFVWGGGALIYSPPQAKIRIGKMSVPTMVPNSCRSQTTSDFHLELLTVI